jgi:hypothetical protein
MISIITITHNRRHFLPLAIQNFNRINNNNIEWIILDDSFDSNEDIIPKSNNINYIYLDNSKINFFIKNCYNKIQHKTFSWTLWYKYHLLTKTLPIGMKRNIANLYAKGDIIVHYDDDDYYPELSLEERIKSLKNYDCTYCSKINCFNTLNQKYFIKGDKNNISEATMTYYKSKWESNKFDNYAIESEGETFIKNLNCNIIDSTNIIISIFHSNNTSISLNIYEIIPEKKINCDTLKLILNSKDNSNCSQNQDLWILRDIFNFKKELFYLSIYPKENYNKLLDDNLWKGIYFGKNIEESNPKYIFNKIPKNICLTLKTLKFPKHINFLNTSSRIDVLEFLFKNKYIFDIIIINFKNNIHFRKKAGDILEKNNMILTKILNNEDCYINSSLLTS